MPVYGIEAGSYRDGGVARSVPAALRALDRGGSVRPIGTAVVLSGGGNRGALQVGMMRALIERRVDPDLFVGTSIGAVNGAAFAGAPTLEGVYLAADVWRRLAAADVFPRPRFGGMWRFFGKQPSVYSLEGLRHVVSGYLRFDRLEEATVPILLIASRFDDGAEEWLTSGPALDAVLASAALPGLYPPVEIGGRRYVDGGVLDNTGISAALACGARRIYVLLCGRVRPSPPVVQRPIETMYAAFNLALSARLRRDLAAVPDGVDVIVVEHRASSLLELTDFSRTEELIEEGYRSAHDALDGYEQACEQQLSRSRWSGRSGRSGRRPERVAESRRRGIWRQWGYSSEARAAGDPSAPAGTPPADDAPRSSTR